MKESPAPLILCVDDDPDLLNLVRLRLEKAKFQVATAQSAAEGLKAVEKAKPDLILLDILMPGMDGYQFCARLQQDPEFAAIPIVFLSALEGEQDRARAFAAGAVDYLPKPPDPAKLVEMIRKHLGTSSHWGAALKSKTRLFDSFPEFRDSLLRKEGLVAGEARRLSGYPYAKVYALGIELGMKNGQTAQAMAQFLGRPYQPLIRPDEIELGILPTPFCRSNRVVPVRNGQGTRAFVLSNPFDVGLLDTLQALSPEAEPAISVSEPEVIDALFELVSGKREGGFYSRELQQKISKLYRDKASMDEIQQALRGVYQESAGRVSPLPELQEESAPIILLVNKLIDEARDADASDIHLEPTAAGVTVRYRIDGDLRVIHRLKPRELIFPIAARIKIMSQLDISERRLPQDGRIPYGDEIDLRVGITPMNFGEKVVLRLLDKQKSSLPLDKLGFSPRHLELYRERIRTPYGLILHVGPTGCGKSMTMFAALKEIQDPAINIQTVEDPIEYLLSDINQLQVNPRIGLTFERAIRTYLRQDPDVILVGEIRDRETADAAIEAALTGHLLFSTLHTNDAPSTIQRFIQMGVEPYLVSSSLVLICAQRLVRRLCLKCKEAYTPTEREKVLAGLDAKTPLFRAKGCAACANTGYKGRIGIHELLDANDEVRQAITAPGLTWDILERIAVEKGGMTTLYRDAMEKVRSGVASLQDALANVRPDRA